MWLPASVPCPMQHHNPRAAECPGSGLGPDCPGPEGSCPEARTEVPGGWVGRACPGLHGPSWGLQGGQEHGAGIRESAHTPIPRRPQA